ncbi:MAG: formamidopyrimidine-DNA glycosylase [Armatimonadetes bacterium]|nr:formamidopyrimidine-DNA glycosylase [Armatimonadota bacterium]
MPELPDVELYVSKIKERTLGTTLLRTGLKTPFLLRSTDPPVTAVQGKALRDVTRLGKRIVLGFDGDLFFVIHLMIAGRFQWKASGSRPPGRITLAVFSFDHGDLVLTEASKKRRASLHVVQGQEGLVAHDPGGVDPLLGPFAAFSTALHLQNRTLKRALTDPKTLSGIGNAYSDEILWAAGLSPLRLTSHLTDEETRRLWEATRTTLTAWKDRLSEDFKDKFPGPGDVTAFRPDFAVHGKFGAPCPKCGHKVQRIVYAENETNYCAACQNEGRLLADRALSRLLKSDWPRTLEDTES